MKPASRILIAGGAGFIGRAVAHRLRDLGHEVTVLTRHSPFAPLPGVRVCTGGLGDMHALAEVLPTTDALLHVASGTTPGSSAHAPTLEAEHNLGPLLRLLESLARQQQVHLVYVSSGGTVYGNARVDPIPESAPLAPRSNYGAGKAAAEMFLQTFVQQGGRATILRPSNVYGPGQSLTAGFGVVRTMLQHVRDGTAMTIWGDGSAVRDYLYIDDMAQACIHALTTLTPAGTFNIGSGTGHSLNEVRNTIEHITGRPLRCQYEPARAIDVMRVVLDVSRAREQLGWQPTVSLAEGVLRTWRWLCP